MCVITGRLPLFDLLKVVRSTLSQKGYNAHKGPGAILAIFMCPETRKVPKCSNFYALSNETKMKKL
jgi:hypothetical protein